MATQYRPAIPHLSWTGPGPAGEMESYALAILVRLAGMDIKNIQARNPAMPPCSLTVEILPPVAMLYAYCKMHIDMDGIKDYKSLLTMIRDTRDIDMREWVDAHPEEVKRAEAELLEYVETASVNGFRVYG